MDNLFKNLCDKIDYSSYFKIKKYLCYSDFSFLIYTIFSKQYSFSEYPNDSCIIALAIVCVLMNFSHGEVYTRDVNKIRSLYNEFLKEYNKLNRLFDLKNPIQVSTMFNYMLYKGYLSRYKHFQFNDDNTNDLCRFFSIDVFSGTSVCRHISSMLVDILNDYGIESNQIFVYSKQCYFDLKMISSQIKSRNELLDIVASLSVNEDEYNRVVSDIDSYLSRGQYVDVISRSYDEKDSFLKRVYGNHAIAYSVYDGKNYFLDPTQKKFYKLSSDNCFEIGNYNRKLFIRPLSCFTLNSFGDFLKINRNLLSGYSNVTDDEIKNSFNETRKMCNDNIDVLEKFYYDHCDLYKDIVSKTNKLRRF